MTAEERRGYELALTQLEALVRETGPAPAVEAFIAAYWLAQSTV